MKVKRYEILNAVKAFSELKDEKVPFKFAYAISKNKTLFEPEITAIAEAEKPLMNDYEKERVALCEKHGERKGNDYEIKNTFIEDFNKEILALVEKYKGTFEQHTKFMNEEIEIQTYDIKENTFPEQVKVDILNRLAFLIKE